MSWEAIRSERLSLVDLLEGLEPQQWGRPSLCRGWTVQDVAAHLAWAPVLSAGAALRELGRAGFRPNTFVADSARRWSRRGRDEILRQLRFNAAHDVKTIGVPRRAVLVDAVVHSLDIRRPLGVRREIPDDTFRRVAAFCATATWPASTLLGGGPRRRIEGLRLVADGTDWSHGAGPDVHGSKEALVLVLSGRSVEPDELTGPGAATLVGRL